ncbi:methyl-accepting chemotaxis protein [Trinickia sp.]|uniref:methyl-accepting chemotaxis protein n=1 Tax=Trinickia sp. TaxID=2571163 RepID=UPI003F81834D
MTLNARRPLVMVTLDGLVEYVNDAFVDALGWTRDSLRGAAASSLLADIPAAVLRDIQRTVRANRPWIGSLPYRTATGDVLWARSNLMPGRGGKRAIALIEPIEPTQSAQAAQAYRMIDAGQAGWSIRAGKITKRRWSGAPGWICRASLRGRIASIVCCLYLASLAACVVSSWNISLDIVSAALLPVFGGGGLVLMRLIHRPLQKVTRVAVGLAAGQLDTAPSIPGDGELGDVLMLLNQAILNLRTAVADVRDGVTQVASGTETLAAGNQDLSVRTEEQVSSVQNTAASVEQLNASIFNNSESSAEADRLARESILATRAGGETVERLIEIMRKIDASSSESENIVSVIDALAFQTNILALNAAVEAARAGPSGRSFAVVASEVRALAQRSAAAASQIRVLAGRSLDLAREGRGAAEQATARMRETQAAVAVVSRLIGEIKDACAEQSHGMAQIEEAITAIDVTTQQNSALVDSVAAISEAMRQRATGVTQALSLFDI